MVAVVIRTIDALKTFDTIFVITQGGPGTASETINIYLYLQAFAFYNIGHASAVVVVFFVIIVALSLLLLWVRQRTQVDRARHDPPRSRAPSPGRPPMASRRWLRKVGVRARRARHRLAGDPGVPLDALAVAQERGRQHRLPAGLHPEPADLAQLRAGVRAEPVLLYSWNSIVVSGALDPGRARCSACRPATASPRRAPRASRS